MKPTVIYNQQGKDSMYKIWHKLGTHAMFLYAEKASGSVVTHEKVFPLTSGALYFVGAKKLHYTMPEKIDEYTRHKIFIPLEFFEKIKQLCSPGETFSDLFSNDKIVYAQIPDQEQEKISSIFLNLHKSLNERQEKSLLVSSCAFLFYIIDRYYRQALPQTTSTNFIFKAIEFINDSIAHPFTIDSICSAVFMSKYYFCRKFKKVIGVSVMEYVLITRLSLSKEMLVDKKLTVSQISSQCGFSSVAYFCNVFKQKNGLTPLQYRKHYAKV